MFKSKTVFVVGAGASHELGFPLGATLKGRIASLVDIDFDDASPDGTGDPHIQEAIRDACVHTGERPAKVFAAGRSMAAALPLAISIDNFLEAHSASRGTQLIGKLGIVRSILDAEAQSALATERAGVLPDFGGHDLQASWLTRLVRYLTEGVRKETAARTFQNVSFVTFNYDRSLEQFLWQALQRYYDVGESAARSYLMHVPVYHAYGSVGRLPWQQLEGPMAGYGLKVDTETLLELSAGIQTFSEQVNDDHRARILECLAEARTVVFLGFGFLEQNMELLTVEGPAQVERVYATAYGLSDRDCDVVRERIGDALGNKDVQIELRDDLTAATLLDAYSRSITR
jgi:hypothetical protein